MEFEKLYMFNPFTIQNADSKQIADTYTKLQNELKISEENYEDFLDNFSNDFSDSVIEFVNCSQSEIDA